MKDGSYNKDDGRRSNGPMSSPRIYGQTWDLGPSFVRNLGEADLLSAAEEQAYARKYSEERAALHVIIGNYPQLLLAELRVLRRDADSLNLRTFFEYSAPTALDISEFDSADGNEDEQLNRLDAVIKVVEEFAAENTGSDALNIGKFLVDKVEFANGMVIKFKESIYTACLKLILEKSWIPENVPASEWEAVSKEISSCSRGQNEALNALVEGNQRLVISIARRFRCASMTLGDMVQEGNLGLMRAVENFDYTLGHRFSTYASYWIRQAIGVAINNKGRQIRLPINMLRQLSQIERVERKILQETGETPKAEQVAEELGISAARVRAMKKMGMQTISLQSLSTEEHDWNELLADTRVSEFQQETHDEALRDSLDSALQILNEREREIIIRRFGLMNQKIETLEQLGVRLGLSCERVRQIEATALGKLRTPGTSRLFEGL